MPSLLVHPFTYTSQSLSTLPQPSSLLLLLLLSDKADSVWLHLCEYVRVYVCVCNCWYLCAWQRSVRVWVCVSEWERALGAALLCPPNHLPEMDVSSGNWPPKKSASNSLILNSAEQIQPTSMPPHTHTLFFLSLLKEAHLVCALFSGRQRRRRAPVWKKKLALLLSQIHFMKQLMEANICHGMARISLETIFRLLLLTHSDGTLFSLSFFCHWPLHALFPSCPVWSHCLA